MNPQLHITPTGIVHGVSNEVAEDIALSLGAVTKRRASHILPCHPVKRLAFRLLRFAFGERGRIATWTRHWRGPWQVTFADAPHFVVFAHPSRRVCLDWEIKTLNEHLSK